MKESSDSPTIYISGDSSKVATCKWCGSVESDDWKLGRGAYCSRECNYADRSESYLVSILCWVPLFSLVIIFAMPSLSITSFAIALAISFVLLGCPSMLFGFAGRAYRKEIPKGSRKTEGRVSELALLRSVTSSVSCPTCDASIDLSDIREDKLYHCDYCGASGIVELLKTEKRVR